MQRTFVIGDIHGAYRALLQCLERSGFNYDSDCLICLGDVTDGWPETRQCIDELLKIKNLIYILGNHDFWTLQWMEDGIAKEVWLEQGGMATTQSYNEGIPEEHIRLLKKASLYYLIDHKLFVHAGIDPKLPIEKQSMNALLWNRNFAHAALSLSSKKTQMKLTAFDEVYIGHTPIPYNKPVKCCEVWLMDTGAGWSGVLSMMNVETKKVFTSDPVPSLYPGVEGRK